MKKDTKILVTTTLMAMATMFQSCLETDNNINVVCNSDCTTIEGRFTTNDGNTPIKNVSLEFDWGTQPGWGLGFGGKTRRIATTRTDENGNYKIKFYAKDEELTDGYFSVEFNVPDNSYITQQDYSYFLLFGINKRDTLITRNYHIPKKGGTIILKIKNPQDIVGDDRLISTVTYKFDDLTKNIERGAGDLFSFYASEVSIPTAANQYSYIRTSKKINGEYFNYLDSIIVSVNETKVYEIEF